MPKSVRRWVAKHAKEFGARPTAFVSACWACFRKRTRRWTPSSTRSPRRFLDANGWHPTVRKVVAGALLYTRYRFGQKRWIMKRIAAKAGGATDTSRDYDYTDWNDVREFATTFGRGGGGGGGGGRVGAAGRVIHKARSRIGATVLQRTLTMTPDIKQILVPLDFSANSNRALDYAHGLAGKFDAALHLIHVCEVPDMSIGAMDAYAIAYSEWSQRLGEEAERELAKIESGLTRGGGDDRNALRQPRSGDRRCGWGEPCGPDRDGHARPRRADAPDDGQRGRARRPHGALPGADRPGSRCARETGKGHAAEARDCRCREWSPRGDGPLAASMKRKPANLTEIAKRNGGQYPSDLVFLTIDGRQPVRGHGGPDMPVWGDAVERSREAGDQARVKAVIQSLVDYLESIQLRPAHEQQ